MAYVLKRHEDGAYVRPPGSRSSYTPSLQHARKFPSRAAAEAEACGNESAVPIEGELSP